MKTDASDTAWQLLILTLSNYGNKFKIRASLSQTKVQYSDTMLPQSPTPRQATLDWQLLGEGESVSSESLAPNKSSVVHWKATPPGKYHQYKLDLMGENKSTLSFMDREVEG